MGRTLPKPGSWLALLLYGTQIAALVFVVLFVALPTDGVGSVALAVLFAGLVGAGVIGLWRWWADRDGEHFGTAEDVAYDPIADPGQAAKDRWQKAVDRLPGRDGDGDEP